MRSFVPQFQLLEPRRLMAAVYPTIYEQYMVELYNQARANPSATATKYGIALNEGPAAVNISTDAKQPLAINPLLNDSARSYSQYLIDHDVFDHFAGGTSPGGRMSSAGYVFGNPSGAGENAALASYFGIGDYSSTLDLQFSNYYTDQTIGGRWHRVNMMDPGWKEIGSGLTVGDYNGLNALISIQDFAFSGSGSFLTGVAYTDSSHDNFYTPGEQMGGVTVTAINNSTHARFSTTTWASGGYSLALPDGNYTVWAGGGTLGGFVRYDNVTIGPVNVKRDFRPDMVNSQSGPDSNPPPPPAFAVLNGNALTVSGTSASDTITLSLAGATLHVTLNGQTLNFTAASVKSITISAGNGNDVVSLNGVAISSNVSGGAGDDSILGGAGSDLLRGDAGNDSLNGANGVDRLEGGDGNDQLLGGSSNDRLYGQNGNDSLWGQNQNDVLDGGAGADFMTGGSGNDTADYSTRSAGVTVTISSNYSQTLGTSGETNERDNVLNDIENINGGAGNDRLIGSSLANVIHGNGGNDTIYGMGGADSLFGEAGTDRFYCSDGTIDRVDGGAGRDIFYGDLIDLLVNVETH
ncbi:MAG TPA: CAP domain-containing protein [Tepidisphaeraceae bacterium]|nr:CAP domain-containing protein [Tepidisphaeraceae bacterium]